MFQFKAYDVNIVRNSSYPEGDNDEFMEAFVNVYENGVYDNIQVYVKVKNGKGYFCWCSDKMHELKCLRSAAVEVIQDCFESVKKYKDYEDRNFLEGASHRILNCLFV